MIGACEMGACEIKVTWNFNVLDMAFKTIKFVQGLSRTPLLFSARYLTTKKNNNSRKSQILKIWKSKNTGSLTSAQATTRTDG